MAIFKLVPNGLNNIVIPSINNAINYINSALNSINAISIPNECNFSIINSKNDIETVKNNLVSLNNWCDNSLKEFSKHEDKYLSEASLLPEFIMPLKNSRIK